MPRLARVPLILAMVCFKCRSLPFDPGLAWRRAVLPSAAPGHLHRYWPRFDLKTRGRPAPPCFTVQRSIARKNALAVLVGKYRPQSTWIFGRFWFVTVFRSTMLFCDRRNVSVRNILDIAVHASQSSGPTRRGRQKSNPKGPGAGTIALVANWAIRDDAEVIELSLHTEVRGCDLEFH